MKNRLLVILLSLFAFTACEKEIAIPPKSIEGTTWLKFEIATPQGDVYKVYKFSKDTVYSGYTVDKSKITDPVTPFPYIYSPEKDELWFNTSSILGVYQGYIKGDTLRISNDVLLKYK